MNQIVYSEKDIEDVLAKNITKYLGIKLIRRQFRTKVGIVDILAKSLSEPDLYYVIEIKRESLDANAYVQVNTYAKWLNSELAKKGKRRFHPLLVGSGINQSLLHLCDSFLIDSYNGITDVYTTSYTLFAVNLTDGVSFSYSSSQDISHKYFHYFSHIAHLEESFTEFLTANSEANNG